MRVWSNLNKQRRDATGVVLKEQYAENEPFLDVPVFVFIHFYFRPFNLNVQRFDWKELCNKTETNVELSSADRTGLKSRSASD